MRTYARIDPNQAFSYKAWMEAVRRAETFVTYGPLLEFNVDGRPMGNRIKMSANGGTVDVTWQVASVTIPMSRVELIVNGEIRESVAVPAREGGGHWSVKVDKSCWLALLVRGHYADKPEIVVLDDGVAEASRHRGPDHLPSGKRPSGDQPDRSRRNLQPHDVRTQ